MTSRKIPWNNAFCVALLSHNLTRLNLCWWSTFMSSFVKGVGQVSKLPFWVQKVRDQQMLPIWGFGGDGKRNRGTLVFKEKGASCHSNNCSLKSNIFIAYWLHALNEVHEDKDNRLPIRDCFEVDVFVQLKKAAESKPAKARRAQKPILFSSNSWSTRVHSHALVQLWGGINTREDFCQFTLETVFSLGKSGSNKANNGCKLFSTNSLQPFQRNQRNVNENTATFNTMCLSLLEQRDKALQVDGAIGFGHLYLVAQTCVTIHPDKTLDALRLTIA